MNILKQIESSEKLLKNLRSKRIKSNLLKDKKQKPPKKVVCKSVRF